MSKIIGDTSFVILLINCLLYFKNFNKFGKAYKYFSFYILSHVIVEIVTRILTIVTKYNLFMSHFYFVTQFVFLCLFFNEILENRFQKKIISIYLPLCIIALAIHFTIHPEQFYKFSLFEIFITIFPLILFCTFYLYEMLDKKKDFYIITIALFAYLLGSSIVFLFGNIINVYKLKISRTFWTLNIVLYFLFQIVLLIEWFRNYSKNSNNEYSS